MKGFLGRSLVVIVVLLTLLVSINPNTGFSGQTPTVRIGSLVTWIERQGELRLQALNISAPGLGNWSIDIQYEPSVVSVVRCEPFVGSLCNPEFDTRTIRVAGANAAGLGGDITLANITFRCDSGGTSDLVLVLNQFSDATHGDPQPINASAEDGSIGCVGAAVATPTVTDTPTPTITPTVTLSVTSTPVAPVPTAVGGQDTPTPTATVVQLATPTQTTVAPTPTNAIAVTPTATIPAGPSGDADCDGAVDRADATLVLQFDAGLLNSLPCEQVADSNGDGAVNSIDATLILQQEAGLV